MSGGKSVLRASEIAGLLSSLESQIRHHFGPSRFALPLRVYGVPRGGVPVALALSQRTGWLVVDHPTAADVLIDDLIDSGATAGRAAHALPGIPFFALVDKRHVPFNGKWVVFPWETTAEHDDSGTDIVRRLLQYIGEDPNREGLRETPRRVLEAWGEWAQGYQQDPKAILKTFEDGAEGCNEMVIVHNIPVVSKCEHHLADIMGTAHVGYIPKGRIVGLSKLSRLTDLYARRLQVQERMTNQIADTLAECLDPIGVGVTIMASHACMSSRGVKHHGSFTSTSAFRGALFDKPEARAEFLAQCDRAERRTLGG